MLHWLIVFFHDNCHDVIGSHPHDCLNVLVELSVMIGAQF